ncbi:MAG: tetratricopeptide repeat protein [Candidatus Viridilinea halotolerans]|uniref:Tetratricopeptide repeat protein n=1 Tax=Candidatus Viridilinea halotolerans TaxID=2491704 RepID=A0A426TS29_9CHLR|nr:MAG: tetratricopeptide repeat protein [Candidatus Viridilinea halotolerans]
MSPIEAIQVVIRAFEQNSILPNDISQLQSLYRSKLQNKKILIIADDAKDAFQTRHLVPPPRCALLLTSRNRFHLPGMNSVELGVLTNEDAVTLLLSICPRIDANAPKLASLCGNLPLALRVSAEVLSANDSRSVVKYISRLDRERLKLLQDPDNPDAPEASVEASLRLSFDALSISAQDVLTQLGVFTGHFDLEAAQSIVNVDDHVEAAQSIVNVNDHVEAALELLRRRSLIDWNELSQRFNLHDLVRDFALSRIKDEELVRLRYAKYYASIAQEANQIYGKGGEHALIGLSIFDREMSHIESSYKWLTKRVGNSIIDKLLLQHDYIITLGTQIGQLRIPPKDLLNRLSLHLDVLRRLERSELEAITIHSMGYLTCVIGNRKDAVSILEQALDIARTKNDLNQESLTLLTMGWNYGMMNSYSDSFKFLRKALDISRSISNKTRESQALDNFGIIYLRSGDIANAEYYYRQALLAKQEIGDIRGEARVLAGIGRIADSKGEHNEAIQYLSQGLTLLQFIGDRLDRSSVSWFLGMALINAGDSIKALKFLQETVEYEEETNAPLLDEHKKFLANLRNNLLQS